MKTAVKQFIGLTIVGSFFIACSQKQEQAPIEDMIKDPQQQEMILTAMANNHDLSAKYIGVMMENEHAMNMMVDGLVKGAANDSLLARKVSEMITNYPDLMLMTVHHFMPVISADETMCQGFCDHALENSEIADEMCHKMKSDAEMSCCH